MNFTQIADTVTVLSAWFTKAMKLGQIAGENSLSDLTKQTKVEPLVIVSKECVGVEALSDIMQGMLNYTIADYAQAVAIFGKINDISVRRALDSLNPNRDGSAAAILSNLTTESLSPAALRYSFPTSIVPTVEARDESSQQAAQRSVSGKEIQEESKNMSVGKLVDIEFVSSMRDEKGQPLVVSLPIQFRLLVSFVNSASLVNLLASGTDDTNFTARFQRAVDGGIRPFLDFILSQDLIEEKRKVMYSDDGRLLQTILKRAAANKRAAWASRSPSLATLANIYIMTEREADEIKARFGTSLDREETRERIYRNVYASTLVIVNRQWNQVTFWHRGIDSPTTVDFKQLKASSGGRGPDLMDMLKSFNLGAPVF